MTTERVVTAIGYDAMSAPLRSLIAYEPNGALDMVCPQDEIDRIRRETPVVRWELGVGFFALDDIVAAARNPHIVSNNPDTGVPFGMGSREPLIPLHLDGDLHRHYRRLLDPLFAPKRMAALEPEIRELADELLDGFIGAGEVELHEAFCVPLPTTIFLRQFGLPLEDTQFLISMKDRILKNEGTTIDEKEEIGVAAGLEMRAVLEARLAERRASSTRRDDLLDQFMHFELDGDRLSDSDVVSIMHLFTIAGLDTVTSTLSCIIAWFATHPDERRRVIAEPSLLGAAIEEILRFESPVPSSGARWAAVDTEVNGVPVKRGELVYFCWAAGNLDPDAFTTPLDVDIDRAHNRHIAFAAGNHRCLGSHLARVELRTAIDQFHRRVSDYWVAEGDEIVYEFAGVRQAKVLPLRFKSAR